jgi:WD40 repeat protein
MLDDDDADDAEIDEMDDLDGDESSGELFECVSTLEGHENEVKSVAWDCSGSLLATCGRDKTVWIWELVSSEESDRQVEFDCVSVLNGHTQDVKQVKWHPSREVLASASYDDTVRMWCAGSSSSDDDWYCADTLREHKNTVWSLDFNADGTKLATASADLDLVVWACSEYSAGSSDAAVVGVTALAEKPFVWKTICTVSGLHERAIYSVSWSRANDCIATASGDDCLRVFRLLSGEQAGAAGTRCELLAQMPHAHATDINCVAWNPVFGPLLASCSDDCSIKLWRLEEHAAAAATTPTVSASAAPLAPPAAAK